MFAAERSFCLSVVGIGLRSVQLLLTFSFLQFVLPAVTLASDELPFLQASLDATESEHVQPSVLSWKQNEGHFCFKKGFLFLLFIRQAEIFNNKELHVRGCKGLKTFQQNRNSKHTVRLTLNRFRSKHVHVLGLLQLKARSESNWWSKTKHENCCLETPSGLQA